MKLLTIVFRCFVCLELCVFFGLAENLYAHDYKWNNIQFTFPDDHWEIVLDDGEGENRQVKVSPKDRKDIGIILTLFNDYPAADEEYNKLPVKLNVAFALGLAIKLAGEDGEKGVALHYGNINLFNGVSMSARFTVAPVKAKKFHVIECFHARGKNEKDLFLGMVLSQGVKGQANDDPLSIKYISEAYEIVRTVKFND